RNRQEKADATDTPILIRQSLSDSIEFLSKQLAQLQQDIDQHIDRHPGLKNDLVLLQSIPAVGPQVGNNMLAIEDVCARRGHAQTGASVLRCAKTRQPYQRDYAKIG
ncbi:MAG TPA: hypothetical protein VFF26_02875, partial [Gallionella sp.]|nr:hypothetical protein [Gallionella sp.]